MLEKGQIPLPLLENTQGFAQFSHSSAHRAKQGMLPALQRLQEPSVLSEVDCCNYSSERVRQDTQILQAHFFEDILSLFRNSLTLQRRTQSLGCSIFVSVAPNDASRLSSTETCSPSLPAVFETFFEALWSFTQVLIFIFISILFLPLRLRCHRFHAMPPLSSTLKPLGQSPPGERRITKYYAVPFAVCHFRRGILRTKAHSRQCRSLPRPSLFSLSIRVPSGTLFSNFLIFISILPPTAEALVVG